MGSPIDRTNKAALDANLINGNTSDAPKLKSNNDTIYNYVDGLNSALETHAGATTIPHADGSVTGSKIRDGALTETKYATGSVTARAVANGVLTAAKFVPGALTNDTQNGLRITVVEDEVAELKDDTAALFVNKAEKAEVTELSSELDSTQAEVQALQGGLSSTQVDVWLLKQPIPSSRLKVSMDADRIKLINLSDEVLQAMAGTTPVNATPGPNSVTTEKIVKDAVDVFKLESTLKLEETIGVTTPGTGTAALAGYTFTHAHPATIKSKIKEIQIFCMTTGTLRFLVMRSDRVFTLSKLRSFDVTISSTGLSTLKAGVHLPNDIELDVGNYFGFTVLSGGAAPAYTVGSSLGYWYKESEITGALETVTFTNTNVIQYNFTLGSLVSENTANEAYRLANNRFTEITGSNNLGAGSDWSITELVMANEVQASDGWLTTFEVLAQNPGAALIKIITPQGGDNYSVQRYQKITLVKGVNSFSTYDGTLPMMPVLKGDFVCLEVPVTTNVAFNSSAIGSIRYSSYGTKWGTFKWDDTVPNEQMGMRVEVDTSPQSQVSARQSRKETHYLYYGDESILPETTTLEVMAAPQINFPKCILQAIILEVPNAGDGSIQLKYLRLNMDGTMDVIATQNCTAVYGQNVYYAGVDFPVSWELGPGLFIGVQTKIGGAQYTYSNESGIGYFYYIGVANGSNIAYGITLNARLSMAFMVSVQDEQSNVERAVSPTLEEYAFTSLPAGWSNTGWTFDGTKASSAIVGLGYQLRSGETYGLDKRTIRWEFEITTPSSVIAFLSNPKEGAIQAGSIVRLNAATNNIEITGLYNGSNNPSVLATSPLGFSVKHGNRYVIEIEKDGRKIKVRVWDKNGNGYSEYERTATPWGYSVYPAWGYDQGALHGAPGVAVIAGSASVYTFKHYAIGNERPLMYVIGDSITEGFGVTDSDKWAALLRDRYGEKDVLISGIGGAVTEGALKRFKSELSRIKPKNVVIYLGSNYTSDATFSSELKKLVAVAKTKGSTVIVCTIPTQSGGTTIVNALPNDVIKVKFDVALTSSGAGTGVVPSFYATTDKAGNPYNDNLHPNATGHQRMYNRFMLDAQV